MAAEVMSKLSALTTSLAAAGLGKAVEALAKLVVMLADTSCSGAGMVSKGARARAASLAGNGKNVPAVRLLATK